MSGAGPVHASAVHVAGRGVLIRGPSGSGKSSLLLALLFADRERNRLIADDRVTLAERGGRLTATAPETIAGLMEVRGQGLLRLPHVSPADIDLVVDLAPPEACPRYPVGQGTVVLEGIAVRQLLLPVGVADGALRVLVALGALGAVPGDPAPQ